MKAQQGELDAARLYQNLAALTRDVQMKASFASIATDEGRHAAVLKRYAGTKLKPGNQKAVIVGLIYRLMGPRFTLNMLAKAEFKAAVRYAPWVDRFPELAQVRAEEIEHGNKMRSML